jgi:hypothetical protein
LGATLATKQMALKSFLQTNAERTTASGITWITCGMSMAHTAPENFDTTTNLKFVVTTSTLGWPRVASLPTKLRFYPVPPVSATGFPSNRASVNIHQPVIQHALHASCLDLRKNVICRSSTARNKMTFVTQQTALTRRPLVRIINSSNSCQSRWMFNDVHPSKDTSGMI